jgi:DNA-binding transcriptional ArsR family regulator
MLDATLRAIAEPRRREILRLIRDQELTAGAIAANFEVTRPAISQHLAVLVDAGLASVRRSGTQRLYWANPEGLAELRDFIGDFWDHHLSRLAAEVELDEQKERKR